MIKTIENRIIIFWLVLFSTSLFGQKTNLNQIGITSENDSYLFISQDQYYTNGLKINFHRFINDKNDTKKLFSIGISHEIYNGFTASIDSIIYHDRPFSGYADFKIGYQQISKNNTTFLINFEIGYLGHKTKAKEIQEYIHRTFGLYEINGWQYQLNQTIAINVNSTLEIEILKNNSRNTLVLISDLNLGNRKTNTSFGFKSIYNLKREKLDLKKSSLNNFNVGEKNTTMMFIYFQPKVSYYVYDLTVSGRRKDYISPIKLDIIPFRFEFTSGFELQKNSYCFKIKYSYTTKESVHKLNTGHAYGSINFSKLF